MLDLRVSGNGFRQKKIIILIKIIIIKNNKRYIRYTVRPRDTRPRATRTSQVHVFELGPKKFEMNEFMK